MPAGLPDLELPQHIAELLDNAFNGNSDFNLRAFKAALWFVGRGLSDDFYVDFVSKSGVGVGYPRNDLMKRLYKTYQDAEEKYDPALAGGEAAPAFIEKMTRLFDSVDSDPKQPCRSVVLALIQHAINTRHNPVNASARQLAAISGKTVPVTARAMNRLATSLGGGVLLGVSYDGVYGHSRLWHLDPCFRRGEGYICTCKYISNPLAGSPESRFVEYVEPLPPGTEVSVTLIASELSITRPAARKLLDKHLDSHFSGGYYRGDPKTRTPAKWWRSNADGSHHDSKPLPAQRTVEGAPTSA